jgi:hypothetical protein
MLVLKNKKVIHNMESLMKALIPNGIGIQNL